MFDAWKVRMLSDFYENNVPRVTTVCSTINMEYYLYYQVQFKEKQLFKEKSGRA
ncbi:unnamed protein product [Ascophyllum nodosum]